jgi:glutaredoxin 3
MTKQVTIYSKKDCQYCDKVKKYLDLKSQPYQVIDLDAQPERHQEAIELSSARTLPVTLVKDGGDRIVEVVVGFNLQKLAPALAA